MRPSERLESLQRFGWRFGLATIRVLLAHLGDPQKHLRSVHVAGTNGKGSTCAYLASILGAAGYRVGLYTSPHLSDPRERFRVDGRLIPRREYERLVMKVLHACKGLPARRRPTYFEAQTALAFLWFLERKVDVAVLETGLGGRLDATNVVESPMAILITPIGLEHREILGPTLERIAGEKAGILKRGCLAATLQENPRALAVLRRKARAVGAALAVVGEDFPDQVPLGEDRPSWDRSNAALAVAGAKLLGNHGFRVGGEAIRRGLRFMHWPGRFETIRKRPLTLLDGAHNPSATRALARALHAGFPGRKWIVLNGYLGDKDVRSCVAELAACTQVAIVTDPPADRAAEGRRVFEEWEREGVPVFYARQWEKALALALAKGGDSVPVLITGSLYLVGACREALVGGRGLSRL